ncbi:MAG: hypothetical protein O3A51_13525, partial [Verrucomicrobia bacterium]|nr:hypothetical protein [Verrucomicrobiota bacterium]
SETLHRPQETKFRLSVLPVVHYESVTAVSPTNALPEAPEPAVSSRYLKLWPLISYRREQDDSLLRILDLWPLKRTAAIDRNYTPLWTLYTREEVNGGHAQELLWGLARSRVSADGVQTRSIFPLWQSERDPANDQRRWRLAYGLAGYEREGLKKRFRLLYFLNFNLKDGD